MAEKVKIKEIRAEGRRREFERKKAEAETYTREFVIIDTITSAPLREHPDEFVTSPLLRIPAGTKIEILEKKDIRGGGRLRLSVTWYKVNYKGRKGWISQYATMGDIIKELDSGK